MREVDEVDRRAHDVAERAARGARGPPRRFFSTRSVCAATSPGTIWPVAGSSGICPLRKTSPPARTACEYGPIAAGASFVAMGCRASSSSRVYSARRPDRARPIVIGIGELEVAAVRDAAGDAGDGDPQRRELALEQQRRRLSVDARAAWPR